MEQEEDRLSDVREYLCTKKIIFDLVSKPVVILHRIDKYLGMEENSRIVLEETEDLKRGECEECKQLMHHNVKSKLVAECYNMLRENYHTSSRRPLKKIKSESATSVALKSDDKMECEICNASFGTCYEMDRHRETHSTKSEPVEEILCVEPEKLNSDDRAVVEKMEQTETVYLLIRCKICGHSFQNVILVDFHKCVGAKVKVLTCKYCQKGFKSHILWERHMLTHEK